MARATRVVLICDFHTDETEAVETVVFQAGRSRYELDVCQEHLDELVNASRRLRSTKRRAKAAPKRGKGASRRRSSKTKVTDNAAIREWARASGYSVNARGRIPGEIVAAYKTA